MEICVIFSELVVRRTACARHGQGPRVDSNRCLRIDSNRRQRIGHNTESIRIADNESDTTSKFTAPKRVVYYRVVACVSQPGEPLGMCSAYWSFPSSIRTLAKFHKLQLLAHFSQHLCEVSPDPRAVMEVFENFGCLYFGGVVQISRAFS